MAQIHPGWLALLFGAGQSRYQWTDRVGLHGPSRAAAERNLMRMMAKRYKGIAAVITLALALAASPSVAATPEEAEFFEKNIRPIFAQKCATCHGEQLQSAGLNLTTPEGFYKGADSGPLLVGNDPSNSRLLLAVGYEDKFKMPPRGKGLPADEIEALTAWIKMGAPWPRRPCARRSVQSSHRVKDGRRTKGITGPSSRFARRTHPAVTNEALGPKPDRPFHPGQAGGERTFLQPRGRTPCRFYAALSTIFTGSLRRKPKSRSFWPTRPRALSRA